MSKIENMQPKPEFQIGEEVRIIPLEKEGFVHAILSDNAYEVVIWDEICPRRMRFQGSLLRKTENVENEK